MHREKDKNKEKEPQLGLYFYKLHKIELFAQFW